MQGYFSEFAGLAVIHFLAVVVPGPDFAVTVRQSVRYGRWAGICTALGIGAGISVHVIYTLLGIGALMHATPWIMQLAKFGGGAYLIYLGVRLLRSKASAAETAMSESTESISQGAGMAFLTGFMTNATNPKATLFFLAVFTAVVSVTTPLTIQIFYGLWMCMVNAMWFILVSFVFSNPIIRQQFIRLGHWFERAMGAILLVFAARLLLMAA